MNDVFSNIAAAGMGFSDRAPTVRGIQLPPHIGEIDRDGQVNWHEHATPAKIMQLLAAGNSNEAAVLGMLALWHATHPDER